MKIAYICKFSLKNQVVSCNIISYCNKIPQTGGLNNRNWLLIFFEFRYPRLRSRSVCCPVRALFMGCRQVLSQWAFFFFLFHLLFKIIFLFIYFLIGGELLLQCCAGFCHKTMQTNYNDTYITSLLSLLPILSSHPIPLNYNRAPSWASCVI